MSSKLLGLVTQNWILGLGYSADQIDWLLDWAIRLGYSAWLLSLYLDILLGYSTLGLLGWDTLLDGRSSRDCCWGDIDSVNRWILGHLNSIRLGLGLLSDY